MGNRVLALTLASLFSACAGSPTSGAKSASAPAQEATAKGPEILGERFVPRPVDDQQQGMPTGVVAVPASWSFDSRVVWNYGNHGNPVTVSMRAQNPQNEEAVFGFPAEMYFDLRPRPGFYRPGQNMGGLVFVPEGSGLQALVAFIQRTRSDIGAIEFAGSKQLPDLPKAMQVPAGGKQQGYGVQVTYALNGKPVEEEFYAVAYSVSIPYDGPQGRTFQINWGLTALHSFRAPAGTLDKRRPVFAAIAKSYRPNPAWMERLGGINRYLAAEFNRQLQAGYDQIAAAARLSQQISANNDAMIASIEQQRQASNRTSSGGGSSGTDRFSDYLRGVETLEDPYYGTTQRSNNQQFHWTDGYGTYRSSNDATYDPNHTEVGNWTPMRAVR